MAAKKSFFDRGLIKYVGYTSIRRTVDDPGDANKHAIYLDSKFRNYHSALGVIGPTFKDGEKLFYCAFTHFPKKYLDEAWSRSNVSRRIDDLLPTVAEGLRFEFSQNNRAGKSLVLPNATWSSWEDHLIMLDQDPSDEAEQPTLKGR